MVTLRHSKPDDQPEMFPAYWFTRLEQAVSDGDFDQAAEASKQLKRFGVQVRYPRPLFSSCEGNPASP